MHVYVPGVPLTETISLFDPHTHTIKLKKAIEKEADGMKQHGYYEKIEKCHLETFPSIPTSRFDFTL